MAMTGAGLLRPAMATEGIWARLDQRGRVATLLIVVAGIGSVGGSSPTLARALVGGIGLVIFVVIAFSARDTALMMITVWLFLLGFVRRALIPISGWAEQDPLLMVGPAAAMVFLLAARRPASPPPRSVLTELARFLMIWSALQIFNPTEASLVAAAQGAMFWVVPMLWFFVGRTLTGAQHDKILRAFVWVSVAVVAHGLWHTFMDLLPFEYTWLNESTQTEAIFMAGFKIRPFSTLTSPQEYGQALSFAIMVVWSRVLYFPPGGDRRHRVALVAFFAAALLAVFYQGGRANFVFCLVALAVITVIRTRSLPLLMFILLGGFGLGNLVGQQDVQPYATHEEAQADSRSNTFARHTLGGLTNPGDSTLPEHIDRIEKAIEEGLRKPFGIGVTAKSIVAVKAGSEDSGSSENDIANTLQSLGTVAGFVYIGFIGAAYVAASRMQKRQPSARHLAWIGMLIAATTQIWSGQMYATSTLLFLALGGLARESGDVLMRDRIARAGRHAAAHVRERVHA